jgi:hypothetical protein
MPPCLKEKTMPGITFNVFGFLQKKFRENNMEPCNVSLTINEQDTPAHLMSQI